MSDMSLMKNKKGLVMGVANERSIAWSIAKKLNEHGAKIALTYQGEALKKKLKVVSPITRQSPFKDQRFLIFSLKSNGHGEINDGNRSWD